MGDEGIETGTSSANRGDSDQIMPVMPDFGHTPYYQSQKHSATLSNIFRRKAPRNSGAYRHTELYQFNSLPHSMAQTPVESDTGSIPFPLAVGDDHYAFRAPRSQVYSHRIRRFQLDCQFDAKGWGVLRLFGVNARVPSPCATSVEDDATAQCWPAANHFGT